MRATLWKSLPAPVVTPHCYLELTFSVIHPTIGKQAGKVFITQETMQMKTGSSWNIHFKLEFSNTYLGL